MIPPSRDGRFDQPGVSRNRMSRAQSVGAPTGSPLAGSIRTLYHVTLDRYRSSVDESQIGSTAPPAPRSRVPPRGGLLALRTRRVLGDENLIRGRVLPGEVPPVGRDRREERVGEERVDPG